MAMSDRLVGGGVSEVARGPKELEENEADQNQAHPARATPLPPLQPRPPPPTRAPDPGPCGAGGRGG